jgi:uncharacterized ferritin-like protein (DUF455 family)
MMSVEEFCLNILTSPSLESKILDFKGLNGVLSSQQQPKSLSVPDYPARAHQIKISSEQIKFPKRDQFGNDQVRGMALHFFANHELQAIEMMAAALLKYDNLGASKERFQKGLLKTIADEQKHLKLYLSRMKELGVEFGDYPLSGFFWNYMKDLNQPENFLALMSLTFEAANLDFCLFYDAVFAEFQDLQTQNIMKTVFADEVAHVQFGVYWMNQWRKDQSLWQYYCDHLPQKISPDRSKGINFNVQSRKNAGLPNEFLDSLSEYDSHFRITQRKSQKLKTDANTKIFS